MNIACRAAVGLVVFLPAAVPLPAAAQSGQITGVVVDTTGGVLPGAGVTLNGGGAVSRGVELAAAAGLTTALRLRGSWSYTHAELSQDSPGLLEGGKDAFKGDRLSGVRIRYAFG